MIKDEAVRMAVPAEPVPHNSERRRAQAKPFIVLAAVAGILFLILDSIIAHTAPLDNLLLSTKWSALGTLHGVVGSVLFISGSISLYLGYRLLTGQGEASADLKIATVVTAVAAFITIVLGNWIYIGYRQPGMIQDYFLSTNPELHLIFFEFKENMALFTVPLAVPAAFILLRYGDQLSERPWLRTLVFLLLALVFLFFLITFGLGAAVTKIKPI